MDGPTLMKALRERKPDIKIIFVSGYAEDTFDKNLADRKEFNFLAKPFTLKQLVTVVKETMAG
jgi:two-component system cell cycle sensor histidine kinase/response regulator CckA